MTHSNSRILHHTITACNLHPTTYFMVAKYARQDTKYDVDNSSTPPSVFCAAALSHRIETCGCRDRPSDPSQFVDDVRTCRWQFALLESICATSVSEHPMNDGKKARRLSRKAHRSPCQPRIPQLLPPSTPGIAGTMPLSNAHRQHAHI